MKMKICTKCDKEKELFEFHKDKKGSYGTVAQCKKCVKIKSDIYYNINKKYINIKKNIIY